MDHKIAMMGNGSVVGSFAIAHWLAQVNGVLQGLSYIAGIAAGIATAVYYWHKFRKDD